MPSAVVDTGPLIHLFEIDRLDIVTAVLSSIHLPEHIEREIINDPIHDFIQQNSESITVHSIPDSELFAAKEALSGFRLHLADLAVWTLLKKIQDAVAVTDDLELRKAIESSGRSVVGTIGILFRGYHQGTIGREQLKQLVDLVFNDSSLYLSSAFKGRVLAMVEQLPEQRQ